MKLRPLLSRASILTLGLLIAAQALLSIPSPAMAASPATSAIPVPGQSPTPGPGGVSARGQQVQAFGGGTPVTNMVLTAPGMVRVDILSHGTNICSGDFGLSTPTLQPIFTNYDQISDFTVADVGTFASGQELTFYLDVSATSCGTPREFSTDYRWAHIFSVGTNLWEIDWEDVQQPDGYNAYGDFVVLVGLFSRLRLGLRPAIRRHREHEWE